MNKFMDTSNSANVSLSELEENRMSSKSARSVQHSLSKAMAEALYQPHTLTQPKPLASRVKNAGKDFLRHNQTCQWIQFMQEQPDRVEQKRDTRPIIVIPDREVIPAVKELDLPSIPDLGIVAPIEPSPASYEEQLRCLHKQQEDLLDQQHRLEDQMELQRKTRQLQSLQEVQMNNTPVDICEIKNLPTSVLSKTRPEVRDQPNCPPCRFRRRLKGCIAQSFAERDEGSIGSLLYNLQAQDAPTEKKSCMSTSSYGSYQRTDGRQYALSQDSGSSISQLLSQLPCSSSLDVMNNASDSSATIGDTVLTDLTIKGRKNIHGDY